MAAGVEIFDGAGNPIVQITDRITRMCGVVYTGISAGSVTIPTEAGTGTVWWCIIGQAASIGMPNVTVSGATLSWNFDYPGNVNNRGAYLIYGLY